MEGATMEPDEDLQALLTQDGLDYAFLRLGELDPDRVALGATEESDKAKIEGVLTWWDTHKNDLKEYVCLSKTVRTKGPLTVVQAIFGTFAHIFGGPIATYATVVLIKKQFGSTINDLGRDAIDIWCGDLKPEKTSRAPAAGNRKSPKRSK
jgi:hypothetical protein